MSIYPILDHATQALARLATEYRGKPRIQALIDALSAQIQDLETAVWELASERGLIPITIDSDVQFQDAVGAQLDGIGQIVGQTRGNADDATYRLFLRGKIRVNLSSGTVEELLDVYTTLEPDMDITVEELLPAGFTLTLEEPITAERAVVYVTFIRQARAGGVHGVLEWQETEDANFLRLTDSANYPEDSTLTGLGDVAQTKGGHLTGAQG